MIHTNTQTDCVFDGIPNALTIQSSAVQVRGCDFRNGGNDIVLILGGNNQIQNNKFGANLVAGLIPTNWIKVNYANVGTVTINQNIFVAASQAMINIVQGSDVVMYGNWFGYDAVGNAITTPINSAAGIILPSSGTFKIGLTAGFAEFGNWFGCLPQSPIKLASFSGSATTIGYISSNKFGYTTVPMTTVTLASYCFSQLKLAGTFTVGMISS